jgi:hypothetical protein
MATKHQARPQAQRLRDPDQWTTGDEPPTAAQESYLHTLAIEAGKSVKDDLTKAEAAKKIEELQEKTGRGQGTRRMRRSRQEGARRSRK